MDYGVNAGVELVKREEFVRDVEGVVAATRRDYYLLLEQELHRATRSVLLLAQRIFNLLGCHQKGCKPTMLVYLPPAGCG